MFDVKDTDFFDLEEEDFSKAVIQENLDLTVDLNNFTSSADSWLKDTTTQKGWIDETSIVSYNDAFSFWSNRNIFDFTTN